MKTKQFDKFYKVLLKNNIRVDGIYKVNWNYD